MVSELLLKWVQFVSIMLYVLVAGVMWGTWLSLARTMTEYDAATFLTDGKHMIENLGTIMAVLMISAVVIGLVAVVLLFRSWSRVAAWLAAIGWLLMIAVLVITLAVEVPIDNMIETWTEATLPADWQEIRARWAAFHTLRTFLSLGAVAAAVAAALTVRTADRRSHDHGSTSIALRYEPLPSTWLSSERGYEQHRSGPFWCRFRPLTEGMANYHRSKR